MILTDEVIEWLTDWFMAQRRKQNKQGRRKADGHSSPHSNHLVTPLSLSLAQPCLVTVIREHTRVTVSLPSHARCHSINTVNEILSAVSTRPQPLLGNTLRMAGTLNFHLPYNKLLTYLSLHVITSKKGSHNYVWIIWWNIWLGKEAMENIKGSNYYSCHAWEKTDVIPALDVELCKL